jgi:small subunit ribosomal protein S18
LEDGDELDDSRTPGRRLMAPARERTGPPRRRGRPSDRMRPRKYTRINVEEIDYKDLTLLRRFLSDRGKVRSRRVTGLSRDHQRQLALAVKRAREIALLPYVDER